LHLKPCAHCDAVNDDDARECHGCGIALQEATAAERCAGARDASKLRTSVPEAFGESLSAMARTDARAIDGNSSARPQTEPASPSDLASAASFVVPPDEERLAAARSLAAARRQRRTRSALAALLVIAATTIVCYEYIAANPVGDWLRAWQRDVSSGFTNRAQPPTGAIDEASGARERAAQPPPPPSGAGDVAPATPASSATEEPPTDNAAAPVPTAVTEQNAPPSAPSAVTPGASERSTP